MIVLMPHCGFLSETSRMLEIGRALRARGAACRFASHGGPYESLLRDAGESVDRLEPAMSDARCARFTQSIPGMSVRPEPLFELDELRAMVKDEARYLREHKARCAVTGFTLGALVACRVAGVPLITEHAGSFVGPVFDAGLVPAPLRPPVPLGRWLPEGMRRWLANQGPTRVKDGCESLNAVARENGVEGVPSLAALLMGDLTLVTDVPEMTGLSAEALAGWTPRDATRYRRSPRLRYTGPLFARFERPVPERVERFLAGAGPVVFVAITSVSADFVRGVVRAVVAAGARALVAGTVAGLDALDGDGVCVAGVLPSHEVFPRVALGVIAGGQGSVQTALWAGRPFVGIPLQPEQDWNVSCAERIGAARRVAPDEASGAVMTAAVRAMLTSEKAREAAVKAQGWLRAVDGPSRAAEEILTFLRETRA